VLTGCAAAPDFYRDPMANGKEFAVDQQLLAEWYADHIHNFDESYSPILVQVEQDQLSGKYFQNTDKVSLLVNLPEFPLANQNIELEIIPISENCQCLFASPVMYLTTIPDGDFHIRAPVLA